MIHKSYGTSDIVLAATLKMHGCQLERISMTNLPSGLRRGVFHFADVTDEMLFDFDAGKFMVEPVSFNSEIRALNAAIKRVQSI
jgi:hypothetical protein